MYRYIPSKKSQFVTYLALKNNTRGEIRLNIVVRDVEKPNTVYTDRLVDIAAMDIRKIKMQFPISGNHMQLLVVNVRSGIGANFNDPTFEAKPYKITGLETCDVWMDAQTESFVRFAEEFSANCGFLSPGNYRSEDGQFLIQYQPYLTVKDQYGNQKISSTPSRVGHITGNIGVSQKHFLAYSVPMRVVILLHEFAHKFQNRKLNKQMDDESAADMAALYVYLGRGYPRTDAREVYLNIFLRARTEENALRYKKIDEFIKRFDKQMTCRVK